MLSPTQYKLLSDRINELQSMVTTSIDFITDFENWINHLQDIDEPVLSIEGSIANTIIVENSRLDEGFAIGSFVENLQLHVLNNTTYTNINDYLQDFGIKVKQLFADVSNRMGYPILHINIE